MAFVKEWEGGVLLRAGKFKRTVGPGPCWKIPGIDELVTTHTCATTERVTQCVTTKDNSRVAVTTVIKYAIKDVRPYLLEIWDRTDVLSDVVSGAVEHTVSSLTLDELMTGAPENLVIDITRRKVNQWGFKILEITFADLCAVRPVWLMHTGRLQPKD